MVKCRSQFYGQTCNEIQIKFRLCSMADYISIGCISSEILNFNYSKLIPCVITHYFSKQPKTSNALCNQEPYFANQSSIFNTKSCDWDDQNFNKTSCKINIGH